MSKTEKVISIIEDWLPLELAFDRDNVGLQTGSTQKEIKNILIALDLRDEVIKEAVGKNIDLIITHHALIYQPLNSIIEEDAVGGLLTKLIREGISHYVAHTNFDQARGGVNEFGAESLGIKDYAYLMAAEDDKYFKFVVYIPEQNVEEVSEAAFKTGAGVIGEYKGCSFRLAGQGTFFPSPKAKPAVGKKGRLNKVSEIRLEMDVERSKLSKLIKEIKKVHPYEEVAYNIYPLKIIEGKNGLGLVGNLKSPCSFSEFIKIVKERLGMDTLKVFHTGIDEVSRVAFCGGSGGRLIRAASRNGADVFVTGDVTYHQALEAQELGLSIIDAGHNPTERQALIAMKKNLENRFIKEGMDIKVFLSTKDTDVWRYD